MITKTSIETQAMREGHIEAILGALKIAVADGNASGLVKTWCVEALKHLEALDALRQPSPSVDMEHKSLDMVKDFREAHLMATKLATDTHGPMPDVGEDDEPNDPWHCFYDGAMTMFNDLRALEARPSAGEEGEHWIPVSTLPKEHRSCWVLVPVDPAHHEGERWVVAEMIRDGDYWHDHTGEDLNDYSNHITHWQYVVRPSPPKK